jgi:hypothetical protein
MVIAIALIVPAGIAGIASTIALRFWLRDRERSAEFDRLAHAAARRSAAIQAAPVVANSPRAPRRDSAERSVPGGPILIAVPDLTAAGTPPGAEPETLSHRYGPIWELADSGASADIIARATGQPIGQVELILGLRRVASGAG